MDGYKFALRDTCIKYPPFSTYILKNNLAAFLHVSELCYELLTTEVVGL